MLAPLRDRDATAAVAADGQPAGWQHESSEPLGWDGIAAIVILLVATVSLRDRVPAQSIGFLVFRVLWVVLYAAALARLVRRFRGQWLMWTIGHQPALCALLTLAIVSALWSLAPLLTLHKSASLLGTTMVAVFIGYACSSGQVMRVLGWTFAVVMLASIAVELLLPTPVGPGVPSGWRGVMGHKNSFGCVAAFAMLFFLVSTVTRRVHPIWGATLCAICLFGVVQARSRTSIVALGASLAVCGVLARARIAPRPTASLLRWASLALVLGVSLLPFVVGPVAAALGNDNPLNGRTHLWGGALTILGERPLTGYGYAVVWGRHGATLLPHIAMTAHRSAASAHNSIVHIATELGIPAAIVACVYLFGALSSAARLFERAPTGLALFALPFLVASTIMGFTEAHLLHIHWIFWILFVAVTVAVQRALEVGGTTPTRIEVAR